jgi:hypothetical protein
MGTSFSSYGQVTPPWQDKYDQYWEFVGKNGVAPYGISLDKSEEELAAWYDEQILAYKTKALSDEQIYLIEKIPGQEWFRPKDEWIVSFKVHRESRENTGLEPSSTAAWLVKQRELYAKKKLPENKIKLMESVPYHSWDATIDNGANWQFRYEEYKSFKEDNDGRDPDPNSEDKKEKRIAFWLDVQRKLYHSWALSDGNISLMNKVPGHEWTAKKETSSDLTVTEDVAVDKKIEAKRQQDNAAWLNTYYACMDFKIRNNRDPFMTSADPDEAELGVWLNTQKSRTDLSEKQLEVLGKIFGSKRDFIDDPWTENYEKYRKFRITNNRPPSDRSDNDDEVELAIWYKAQTIAYERKMLLDEKTHLLETVPGHYWQTVRLTERERSFLKPVIQTPVSDENVEPVNSENTELVSSENTEPVSSEHTELVSSSENVDALKDIPVTVEVSVELPPAGNMIAKLLYIQKKVDAQKLADGVSSENPEVYKKIRAQMIGPVLAKWKEDLATYINFKKNNDWQEPSLLSDDIRVKRMVTWLNIQRAFSYKGRPTLAISPFQVILLESVPGFCWSLRSNDWYDNLALYELFKRKNNGKDPLPKSNKKELTWLNAMRRAFWDNKLTLWQVYLLWEIPGHYWGISHIGKDLQERINDLVEKEGYFSWDEAEKDFNKFVKYAELKEQGTADADLPEDITAWLKAKRTAFMGSILSRDEIDRFYRFVKDHKWIADAKDLDQAVVVNPPVDDKPVVSNITDDQNKTIEQDVEKVLEEKTKDVVVDESDLRGLLLLYTEGNADASNAELANEAVVKIAADFFNNNGFLSSYTVAFMGKNGFCSFIGKTSNDERVRTLMSMLDEAVAVGNIWDNSSKYMIRSDQYEDIKLGLKILEKGFLK